MSTVFRTLFQASTVKRGRMRADWARCLAECNRLCGAVTGELALIPLLFNRHRNSPVGTLLKMYGKNSWECILMKIIKGKWIFIRLFLTNVDYTIWRISVWLLCCLKAVLRLLHGLHFPYSFFEIWHSGCINKIFQLLYILHLFIWWLYYLSPSYHLISIELLSMLSVTTTIFDNKAGLYDCWVPTNNHLDPGNSGRYTLWSNCFLSRTISPSLVSVPHRPDKYAGAAMDYAHCRLITTLSVLYYVEF